MTTTPTKKCNNCDQEISAQKIILHERYCKDNIVKCPICQEAVLKDELDEHNEDNHAKISCSACGKSMDKALYSEHKAKCSKQLVQCEYCQLSLSKDELHDHEYVCGSKTEECCLCHEMIPKMEYDLHIQYKCRGTNCNKEETINDLLLDSVMKTGIKVTDNNNVENKRRNRVIRKENYHESSSSDEYIPESKKRKDNKKNEYNNNNNNTKNNKKKK